MKEIINKIFCESGFTKIDLKNKENYNLDFYENIQKETFYVSYYINIGDISNHFLSTDIPKIFSLIKDNHTKYINTMDKNLTMLVLIEGNESEYSNHKTLILDIEEDPYFFKKNVISYSVEEVEKFNLIKLDSITSTVNEMANNISEFEKYKHQENSIYEFCTKLLIKIPFLKHNNERQDIINLERKIELNLLSNEVNDLHNMLFSNFENSEEMLVHLKELYND